MWKPLTRILDIFSRRERAPAGRTDRPAPPVTQADIATQAESTRQTPRAIPRALRKAPNTYIFDLALIRAKLGNRWDQFAPSVHRIAQRLIVSTMDGKGSFERFGDAYVLTFDRLRGEGARLEGERLYGRFMELLSKGHGEPNSGGGPRAKTHETSRKRVGLLRRLARRLKSLFTSDGDSAADVPKPEEAEPPTPGEVAEDAAAASIPARGTRSRMPAAGPGGGTAGQRVKTRRFKALPPDEAALQEGKKSPRGNNKAPEHLKLLREARTIENAIALSVLRRKAEHSADMASRDFPPPDLDFIYRSMWNLRTRFLTTYTSVPVCWKSSMEVHHGENIVPAPRRADHLFELDMQCLDNTVNVLGRLATQKRPVLFMNVVHAATLTNKETAREFFAVADSIPQSACRQLIFEVVDIIDYAHHPGAMQIVRSLLPYARAVTASVGLRDRNFAFWKQCGFMGVGADMSRDLRTEEEIFAGLGNFAAQAKRHKLVSYLRELDTFSLATFAAGAGFDFLEGAVVGSSDDPDNLALSKFNVEDLFEDTHEVVWAE